MNKNQLRQIIWILLAVLFLLVLPNLGPLLH